MLGAQTIKQPETDLRRPAILVIGAGAGQFPFLAALSKDYRLLGTDRDPNAAGRVWLAYFLCAPADDADSIVRFADEHAGAENIVRVMSFTSGAPQRAAAGIAQRLGIPGPVPELIDCALSKRQLSEWLCRVGVGQGHPYFAERVDDAVNFLASITGHYYLKPDRGEGGNGVAVVNAPAASRETIAAVFAAAGEAGVVVEPEARGTEYVVTVAVRDGEMSFFPLGQSIKLRNNIGVPVGQILGACDERLAAPVMAFVRCWLDAFKFRNGILGFEVLLDGNRMTVLDLDLSYFVPVRLALRAGNVSIPDCLIGAGDCVQAARFPRARGLMHAVTEVDADELGRERPIDGLVERRPDCFTPVQKPRTSFQTSHGRFLRVGHWQLDGANQDEVKEKFQIIARDYCAAEIL